MSRTILIEAGERKRIITRFSSSLVARYRFTATPLEPDAPLSGTVEVRGSAWIFPKPARTQPLEARNEVAKGFWDTIYRVEIIPDHDVMITVETGVFERLWIPLVLAAGIVFAAALIVLTTR
ncbi:MAG: hypothetical protein C0606_08355 [Hyphomicrobiales bacterium]|nr:MAG: hypothetical protein C0606_08355 [Hyphomicrobiales bacterium]